MGSKPKNISASRGAKILGLSKWGTPVDAWLELMEEQEPGFCDENNFEAPEPVDNAAVKWGSAFENAVIEIAEWILERNIEYQEKFFETDDGLITCHIDGCYLDVFEDLEIIHEGKTTNVFTFNREWGEPGTDRVPIDIQTQVQQQLMLTGLNQAIVSVLVFPMRQNEWEEKRIEPPENPSEWAFMLYEMGFFHQYVLTPNYDLHATMRDHYLAWWNEYIIGRCPPPIKTYSDARKLIRAPTGTIVVNETIERWAMEYKQIGQEIAEANRRKDELKARILAECERGAAVDDEASSDKWLMVNDQGKKLFSYNGKMFR